MRAARAAPRTQSRSSEPVADRHGRSQDDPKERRDDQLQDEPRSQSRRRQRLLKSRSARECLRELEYDVRGRLRDSELGAAHRDVATPSSTDHERGDRKGRHADTDECETGQVVVTRRADLVMRDHVRRDVSNDDPKRHEEERDLPRGHWTKASEVGAVGLTGPSKGASQ